MSKKDFTENKTAQVGAGMTTVGLFGKTAAITKSIGVTAGLKGGALLGGILSAPLAIGGGLALIAGTAIWHLVKED